MWRVLGRGEEEEEEGMSVNDVYDVFKGTVMEAADEVVGFCLSSGLAFV